MQKQTFRCDKCCSIGADGKLIQEALRTDPSNFIRHTMETMSNVQGPIAHSREEFIICTACNPSFLADINETLGQLRTNQNLMKNGDI